MNNYRTRLIFTTTILLLVIIGMQQRVFANESGVELAETLNTSLTKTNFIGKLRTQTRVLGRIPALFEIQHRSGYPFRLTPNSENQSINYYILEHPGTADHIDTQHQRILPDAGQRPIGLFSKVIRQKLTSISDKDWKVANSTFLGFKVKVYEYSKIGFIKVIVEQSRKFPLLIEINENGRRLYDFKFESIQFVSYDLVPITLFNYPKNYNLVKLAEKDHIVVKIPANNVGTLGSRNASGNSTIAQSLPNTEKLDMEEASRPQFLPLIPKDLPDDWLLNNLIIEPFGSKLIYRLEFINDKTNRIISVFQLDDPKLASPLTQNRQVGGYNLVTGDLMGVTYVIVGRESIAILNSFANRLIRNDDLAIRVLQAIEP